MSKYYKTLVITSVILLLPILAGVILWENLPGEIPIHWNISGEVDDTCGKPFAVFGMPLILLGIHFVAVFALLFDPKKQNHSEKVRQLSLWIVPLVSLVLSAMMYSTAMGGGVRVEVIVPLLMGLLFIIIGNYLPKCRQNYTIGIKVPWTLNSEENWNRTHRVGGIVFVIAGTVIALCAFFGLIYVMLPALAVAAIVPIAYSFCLHLKGV